MLTVRKVLPYQNLVNLLLVFRFFSKLTFKLQVYRRQWLHECIVCNASSLHNAKNQTTRSRKVALATELFCFQLFYDIPKQMSRYLLFLSLLSLKN